jgi:hypothetical protein
MVGANGLEPSTSRVWSRGYTSLVLDSDNCQDWFRVMQNPVHLILIEKNREDYSGREWTRTIKLTK